MSRISFYLLALFVIAVDQFTKHLVLRAFLPGDSRDIVPGFFALTFVRNTGGAFGILPAGTLALAAAALVAAAAVIIFTLRSAQPMPRGLAVSLALPLGGAMGNFLDRVRLRYVVDFFDVHAGSFKWPVFNIADSAICIGVALLAFYFWKQPLPSSQEARPARQPEL